MMLFSPLRFAPALWAFILIGTSAASWAQTRPAPKPPATRKTPVAANAALIEGIDQEQLRAPLSVANQEKRTTARGLFYAVDSNSFPGLRGEFWNGVFDSTALAERAASLLSPQEAAAWKSEAVAPDSKSLWLWRSSSQKEQWRVAVRERNAAFGFEFQGQRDSALRLAERVRVRLQKEDGLVSTTARPGPQIVAPRLAVPGETIPLFLKWFFASIASVSAVSSDDPNEAGTSLAFKERKNTSAPALSEAQVSLGQSEATHLSVVAVSASARVRGATVPIRFVAREDAGWQGPLSRWTLPENALIFRSASPETPTERLDWSAPQTRELQNGLERRLFQLEAWNSLAAWVQPAWLPPRETIAVGRDLAEESAIFCAPWQSLKAKGVFYGRTRGATYFYLEQTLGEQSAVQAEDVVNHAFFAALANSSPSWLARNWTRQRKVPPATTGENKALPCGAFCQTTL